MPDLLTFSLTFLSVIWIVAAVAEITLARLG